MNALLPMLCWMIVAGGMMLCARAGGEEPPRQGEFPVAAYGAKADGTTDDTAAIQKAIDAAAKLGGIVTLPAGKFLVAGNLTVPVKFTQTRMLPPGTTVTTFKDWKIETGEEAPAKKAEKGKAKKPAKKATAG